MIVCAGLGIFVGLMGALHERRADLALLRLLGAGPGTIVITILGQGLLLGVGGVILGTALGHAGAEWIGVTMHATHRVALTGFSFVAEELLVVVAALGLALVASSFPAWRAYREALPAALAGR